MKIKIKVLIKNEQEKLLNTYNAIYIKDKEIIKYLENDKTNVTINLKDNILIRENDILYMKYVFKINEKSTAEIFTKQYNKNINLLIKTLEINKTKNDYEVKYLLEDSNEKFIYKISFI